MSGPGVGARLLDGAQEAMADGHSATATLAAFVADSRPGGLPPAARAAARLHFLDTLGVIVAGSQEPAARAVQEYIASLRSDGPCSVIGSSRLTAPAFGALANGTAAHAVEYEDGHDEAGLHPSVCVIPAALAAAERRGASYGELIDAIVLGYEVACRLARCCQSRRDWLEPSWHFTTLCGTFGAVAAAARIERLNPGRVEHAFGIATSMAAGHILAEHDGADSKFFQAGWGAHIGVVAVDLAQRGLTAPTGALERPAGFLPLYIGAYDLDLLLRELGAKFEITGASLKPYPTCRYIHGIVDAVLRLREQPGFDLAQVSEIEVRLPETAYVRVVEPAAAKRRPANPIVARFSAPYVTALAMLHGGVELAHFRAAFPDERCYALAERIHCSIDDTLSVAPYAAEVAVTIASGRLKHRTIHPTGSPQQPLGWPEVRAKVRACIGTSASTTHVDEFIAAIKDGSAERAVRDLLDQMRNLSSR